MSNYTENFFERQCSGSQSSAATIVPIVLNTLNPSSVIDFGCGTGVWLAEFARRGVSNILGIDGPWVTEKSLVIDRCNFLAHDLTKPLRLKKTYDLAMSVEVAEHLSEEIAPVLVESLVQSAPIVLFSAAIPHQGGVDHVNEQWPSYWSAQFARHRYQTVDFIRSMVWQDASVQWWYAQNMLVFIKDDKISEISALRDMAESTPSTVLSLVHPRNYVSKIRACEDPSHLGAWTIMQSLIPAFYKSLKRRIRGRTHLLRPPNTD